MPTRVSLIYAAYQVNLAGRDPATGESEDPRYMTLRRLQEWEGNIVQVRQFLWDEIGLKVAPCPPPEPSVTQSSPASRLEPHPQRLEQALHSRPLCRTRTLCVRVRVRERACALSLSRTHARTHVRTHAHTHTHRGYTPGMATRGLKMGRKGRQSSCAAISRSCRWRALRSLTSIRVCNHSCAHS